MKKVLRAAGKAVKRLAVLAIDLYRRYPARANTYIASGVVFLAGVCGIAVGQESVLHAVELAVPILIGGELTHRRVRPV